jgi:hypothetical protein
MKLLIMHTSPASLLAFNILLSNLGISEIAGE